jgi:hypothetical protein
MAQRVGKELTANISNHGFDSNLSFMILCKLPIKKGCCPLYWIAVHKKIKGLNNDKR